MSCVARAKRRTATCSVAAGVVLTACAVSGRAGRPLSPDRELLDLVVFGPHAAAVDRSRYPPAVRSELRVHLRRQRMHRTRLSPALFEGLTAGEREMVGTAWVGYERRLAAWSPSRAGRIEAARYVEQLRPCYEWEGFHDCPEAEARFAMAYLTAHPDSSFAAFLPLLAAHRWLCAAEGYDLERAPAEAARARAESAKALAAARSSPDPLIHAAAEGLASSGQCFD